MLISRRLTMTSIVSRNSVGISSFIGTGPLKQMLINKSDKYSQIENYTKLKRKIRSVACPDFMNKLLGRYSGGGEQEYLNQR